MKQALLVIDVQNDYFPGGKMILSHPEAALAAVNRLEADFQAKHLPIIYIQHIKRQKDADFFEEGTVGAQLHPDLHVTDESIIIKKHFPNSFQETRLATVLQELAIDQLVICGMMTQMCIDSTTRASFERGYQPILIQDATATKALTINGESVSASHVQTAFIAALTNFASVQNSIEFIH